MRQAYFVDTWFFVASIDRFDEHHSRALRVGRVTQGSRLVTTDAVLSEVLAFFSGLGRHMRSSAVDAVRYTMRAHIVIPTSGELFARGVQRYSERPDKEYSLVDCMSMLVMGDLAVTHILTNDHHFRQEGFVLVNE